ncbi:MAG: DUF6265 family protein [Pseudomonadota bacterium]
MRSLLVVVVGGFIVAGSARTEPLPPGEQQALVSGFCGACHSLSIVRQQRLDQEGWDKLLTWMSETQNMPALAPALKADVVQYLAQHFGPAGDAELSDQSASSLLATTEGLQGIEWQPAMREAGVQPPLEVISWLLGRWRSPREGGFREESWERAGAGLWRGASIVKRGEVVRVTETLAMVSLESGVYYLADVPGNPVPILFELTEYSASQAVFENPEYDFPRRLDYRLQGDGGLQVILSDGAEKSVTLHFAPAAD